MMWDLPPELVVEIISVAAQHTCLSLSATNKYLRCLALPYLYETIHFSAPDTRLEYPVEYKVQRDHFRRFNQLLRSLVNNPILARYIHRIELVRWEIGSSWAGIHEEPVEIAGGVRFTPPEMEKLRHVLASVACRVGCPARLAPDEPASDQADYARSWWMEMLQCGMIDASFAVLLCLLSKEQAGKHKGLRDLRLKLDSSNDRSQPECLWWVLGHLLGNPLSSEGNLEDRSLDAMAGCTSRVSNALPHLQRVDIIATKGAYLDMEDYDCNISQTAIPFLFHRSLSDLRLTLLDKARFSWRTHQASMPSNPLFIPKHQDRILSGPPMTQLRTLHLKLVYLENLHAILMCAPNITTLSFTQIVTFMIPRHDRTKISILASALALVKKSLVTLSLHIFINGDNVLYDWQLGQDCGPIGDPRRLRLWEFPNLRNLTIGLTLLLGVRGSRLMSLAEALPLDLEVLVLVFDLGDVPGGDWEDDVVVCIVRTYVEQRGQGVGGKLKKVVFLHELANDYYNQWEAQDLQDWPPKKVIPQLLEIAGPTGVLIESASSHEHMRWYHDYNVGIQRPTFYELPRHSTDPVLTKRKLAWKTSHVQVWGDYDEQGLPIVTYDPGVVVV